jgi:hypothetical protein
MKYMKCQCGNTTNFQLKTKVSNKSTDNNIITTPYIKCLNCGEHLDLNDNDTYTELNKITESESR